MRGTTVLAAVGAVLAKVPGPSPTPAGLDPYKVSPGLAGFLVVFALALASILLYLSLTKQLRRVNRRAAQQEAEDAARDAERGPDDDEPRAGGPATPGA